jgi:hypothetical protein
MKNAKRWGIRLWLMGMLWPKGGWVGLAYGAGLPSRWLAYGAGLPSRWLACEAGPALLGSSLLWCGGLTLAGGGLGYEALLHENEDAFFLKFSLKLTFC